MNESILFDPLRWGERWVAQAADYWVDASQRWLLFLDVQRRRGNGYLEHLREGQPPVLTFDYEVVLDGRALEAPVNYALLRILNRRRAPSDRRHEQAAAPAETRDAACPDRRHPPSTEPDPAARTSARPVVIIDPRAGHGPGIGGMKQDSQVGMALDRGHPVYFVVFYPAPVAGQTLADVERAEAIFVRKVAELHPEAPEPAVIGNCQAGWAAALLAAGNPGLVGPLVLNGSPLSYWAGVEGRNPMRYRGGLLGGIWLVSLLSDLGGGRFDGAHLVAGFEDLNPANTYWKKAYSLYANVDTEEKRYLEFERWWTGFFDMTEEEIQFIVRNLFIGNRLETGGVELGDRRIDLRDLREPVVVFSSAGDNITPPQQALNWIPKVWESLDELKRDDRRIVYLLHEDIGHLGIFVSGKVAKREHREIIGNLDLIDALPPGLFELVIEESGGALEMNDYRIRFEKRSFEDIRALDDGDADEEAFEGVAALSEHNDRLYRRFARPWVRAASTPASSQLLRQLHPLRVTRYTSSDLNPLFVPVKAFAPLVRAHRRRVRPDNVFLAAERLASQTVATLLDAYRDTRDLSQERLFRLLYGQPWARDLRRRVARNPRRTRPPRKAPATRAAGRERIGGFPEAVARVLAALTDARRVLLPEHLELYSRLALESPRLGALPSGSFAGTVREQAGVYHSDPERGLGALRALLPSPEDRLEVARLADWIHRRLGPGEEADRVALERVQAAVN